MTSNRILQLNAISTAASAFAMLALRGTLFRFFGLDSPLLLDGLALGLLVYAAALLLAARQRPVTTTALMAFTVGDAIWVVASAIVLVMFWNDVTPTGRVLITGAALIVEVFAALQFRAARLAGRSMQPISA